MKYNKGDIICYWSPYEQPLFNHDDLWAFGKIIKETKYKLIISWIRIPAVKQYTENDKKNNTIVKISKAYCSLLIRAKDLNRQEDWRSLLTLARLKL